ncbi:MAG: hypothetical protein JXQ90_12830 [Cyclobacteriaceae bacterium]
MLQEIQEVREEAMQEMPEAISEVYATSQSGIWLCDATEKFTLRFHDQELELKFCDLISFKRKLDQIDLVALLESDQADIEIIYLPKVDKLFALGLREILEMRDLMAGAFTMLELNSLIHKQILRKI